MPRFLAPALTRLGFVCLAFNRRGHDILSTRASRAAEGAAYQLTREAIADNRTAAEWLEARGFPEPIVIGHSNGGLLAARHVAEHARTPALVLLSAHCGGREMVPRASAHGLLAKDRLDELTAQAQSLVRSGRGCELMQLPGWWYVASAESFLDLLAELPDLVELAPAISCPILYVRGDSEPEDLYPARDFAQHARGPCTVEIVQDCDHFYVGREDAITDIVCAWLQRICGRAA
jgi:pimeloyl-ACP methyl ester carboxylesterase